MISSELLKNSLIILSEGFWILSNWSQFRRIFTRNNKGLSAPTQTLNAAGNIAWITYFSSKSLMVPTATNAINFFITLFTLAYVLGNKKQFFKGIIAIIVISPITSYLLISNPDISGWLAVAYNTIASTPWLFHVITTKKTSGISEKSLYLNVTATLLTATYAILIGSGPLILGTSLGMITTIVIM
ncbi:MAG: hypothetical protein Q7T41_04190, partial [Candidatus Saccharibacteria bacterium]|nr:hypothetical protein [Candidatus Saccharibacteria bacterium]